MVREVRVSFCPKLHRMCNKSILFFILCTKSNLEKMHIWKTECRSGPLALVLNEILENWPELESLAGFISLHFLRDHLRVKTTQKKGRKKLERKPHLVCQELITWKNAKSSKQQDPPHPPPMFWPSDELPWAIRSSHVTLTFPKHNLLRVLNS